MSPSDRQQTVELLAKREPIQADKLDPWFLDNGPLTPAGFGIDLPTVGNKVARQTPAAAIDANLPQPFERTAVNGFGFVQIIRPRLRASLVELAQDRASFEARALLRRAAFEPPGPKRLVAHPAIAAVIEAHPQWLEALARQVGGAVGLRVDAALPISGAYAESA